ncbi:MAG: NADP-dependent isocitrate dehydrogenase, partial [Nitrospina sp.]|nr:NADP-dependent isocitrate dehydrogenase [Nitrospina sp.]
ADTLNRASEKLMENKKSPGRDVGQLDNAGTHVYETLYWAQELAKQDGDADLKAKFAPIAKELESNLDKIIGELDAAQGKAKDIGGYFKPDSAKVAAAMRPSATFNGILGSLS